MKQFYLLLLLFGFGTYAHGQVPTPTPDSLQMITEEPLEDAEFPGGYEKLQAYIKENIDLSSILNTATEPLVNVKVIVRFDIEKDGSISNASVEKETSKCLACQKEALRLVESMPLWTPAMLDGKPQMISARIPIDFIFEPFVEAEFPGGIDALHKFIQDSINLFEVMEFSDQEMYNKLIVRFLVNKDGSIENAIISKAGAYCPPCNKEALRLVRSMPKWTPGSLNGQPVSMYFSLPIIFSLQ